MFKQTDDFRIIEDPGLIIDGPAYEAPRTWVERFFTLPWSPWKSTKTVIPKIPSPDIYKINTDCLVMHPATAVQLKQLWIAPLYHQHQIKY